MPTYSYTCNACKHEMDVFQKITDDPLVSCPSCGKDELVLGIGGGSASFQFMGSGFYKNDYKKSVSSSCCPCGKDSGSCH